jgi:ribosomal protein S12 methylthiotransferase accessory factor
MQRRRRVVKPGELPRLRSTRFHPDREIHWVEGWDVVGREPVLVPRELVHADDRVVCPSGSRSFYATTNGLASGNHPLEALSHGISEVVERDASTLWSRLPRHLQDGTRLDLDSVDDPACRAALQRFDAADVAVAAWEATTDVGLPVFICVIAERDPTLLRPIGAAWGAGCHPARGVALHRALTEAAQSRLTLIAGSRDDFPRWKYGRVLGHAAIRRERGYVTVRGPMRRFAEVPTRETETFDEDIAWQIERLTRVGVERVVAVDLTDSEIGLPVVRVVIPRLEGPGDESPAYLPGPRARSAARHVR